MLHTSSANVLNLVEVRRSSTYEFVLNFRQADGTAKWYKFDDGEVTECKMEDEEEMKTQCFGGDYMGEVRYTQEMSFHGIFFP